MTSHKIFVDSWGFINFFNEKEICHYQVLEHVKNCSSHNYKFYTSNFIVSETITFLYRKFGHDKSKASIDMLFQNIETGLIHCIEINEIRMKNALKLRYLYKDKPKISFVDLSSMVVMKEFEINQILTMDKHFEQVNLGFELKPELQF